MLHFDPIIRSSSFAKNIKTKQNSSRCREWNADYLKKKRSKIIKLGRGFSWLDTGTHRALLAASEFVSTIEKRQGLKIACLEEIAFNFGWISHDQVVDSAIRYKNSPYGEYLHQII